MNPLKSIYVVISFYALVVLCTTSSCKKDGPTPQEVVRKRLIGSTWKIKSVTVDGVDKTTMYTGMTIQFTATSYSTTNGGVIWPPSGMWSFNLTDGTMLLRDDATELTISVTDTSLSITLVYSGQKKLWGEAGPVH